MKNSYDADASVAKIIIKKVDNSEEGEIIIEDDGSGMTPEIIKNVWMEPGSDYKEQIIKQSKRTSKFGRLPLGEKGIGRFAVHKLGNTIELITKAEGHPEIYLKIDWNIFKKTGYLDEFPVEIIERDPVLYKNTTGTKIIVKKLKKIWSRGMARDVYRSVNSFCSPFDSPDSFRIIFEIDKKEWLKGLLSLNEIKESALFKFYCEIDGEESKAYKS